MSVLPWRLVEVAAEPAGSPPGWAHRGAEALDRAACLERDGHEDLATLAVEFASQLAHQEDELRTLLVAVDDDDSVVGRASIDIPTTSNLHAAWVSVVVHPAHRRRGLGAALLERAEKVAADAGRGTLQAELDFAEQPGSPPLVPPTGSGAAPADAPGVRFALAHGYALAQVDRRSLLPVPVAAAHLDRLEAQALPHADGYRLHRWDTTIPDAWLDAFALLETRMSTDAPVGALDYREDPWDAARVQRMMVQHAEQGREYVITAAEREATGELAAMTMLMWQPDQTFAFQWDTIVLAPHRGHRLGMLVKVANLRALAELRPDVERVHTWNAEENDHMLAINVALGFRPAGGAAGWQKVV
ncbi:GCN5-related N-acetyltransferase [Xylanimonas cellulosilytica DSM 15894]|uniref:GCN5-related N-acetyltransferase n=1 Tax=Xylanimonas cellulosilytica (strain DSM 15894 / JCM 12276 / CECT 5975 / KCTC 9989 / LMG 20990 / NBRC 107835 / XIL07) TaxID=446471 RepID=D1BUI2_XYLCX|nr:GNAT family N-acetyltransferase [Xylanimonas cellulosilytica]ACZ29223.1 GCN5-related N-acetyltransferase [Xylanimonas cellulosilytica DSM 15894]